MTVRLPARWSTFLDGMYCDGPIPIEFGYDSTKDEAMLTWRTTDVSDGKDVLITRYVRVPPWQPISDPIRTFVWIREQVHWVFTHEADERIMYKGDRMFVPDDEHFWNRALDE